MKTILTSFLSIIICLGLHAQDKDMDSVYTFNLYEAIDFALNNQKDVLNSKLDVDISQKKVDETVGIGLPQITASFDIRDYEKIPTQFIPDFISPTVYNILYNENLIPNQVDKSGQVFPVQFGTQWSATAGVSFSQLLFDPSFFVGVKASKTYRELSEKNLERTKIDRAILVTKAYYLTLLVRERKKVVDANEVRLTKLLDDTKALYENGFVEKMDYDRIQVAKNNVVTEADNFIKLLDVTEKTLKYHIGLPYNTTLYLTDSLDVNAVKKMKDTLVYANPSDRIEYSLMQTQGKLQEYSLKRYKKQYWPTLYAYGTLSTMAQRTTMNVFDTGYPWYPTTFIGATLNFNLFDGTQRENKIKQEKLNLRKIENDLIDFENAVNLEVSSSRTTLQGAIDALTTQEKNLELATSISRSSKIKYEQGIGSNLEVMDAETALKEAQVNYFNALYNALLAKIDLEKAIGKYNY
jgi:outer membrane protein